MFKSGDSDRFSKSFSVGKETDGLLYFTLC